MIARDPFLSLVIRYDKLRNTGFEQHLYTEATKGYYRVHTKNNSIEASLRIRSEYPGTHVAQDSANRVACGYGFQDQLNNEFLHIEIAANGHLLVHRDMFTTLPVFYAKVNDLFVLSNDYAFVVRSLPKCTLNFPVALGVLGNEGGPMNETLLREVHVLLEREKLEVSSRSMQVHQPAGRRWLESREAAPQDPTQFRAVFDDCLDHVIHTRLANTPYAFEVSGGLDSSIMPLYLAKRGCAPAPMVSILYDGKYRASQARKLETIARYTGGILHGTMLDPRTDFPLANILMNPQHFHYHTELYAVPFARILSYVAASGVKVVCRGSGGDDVFENVTSAPTILGYGEHEQKRRKGESIPEYYTDQFRVQYLNSTPDAPPHSLPLHAWSFASGQTVYNKYIEQDLWPTTPFAEPALYEFCQGLPAHFRHNKSVLRLYCRAYKFPQEVYEANQNEDFGLFFDSCFVIGVYDALFESLLPTAISVRLGLIDTIKLLDAYAQAKTTNGEGIRRFELYRWLNFELTLRLTPNLAV